MTTSDWDNLDQIMAARLSSVHNKTMAVQKSKFERMCVKGKKKAKSGTELRVVVNLSFWALDKPTWSVLSKGLNFAIAPANVLVKEIICGIEMALKYLPLSEAEEVRGEVC